MRSHKISHVLLGLCIVWLIFRGIEKGWTLSIVVPLVALIAVFAASFLEVSHMGLFGKSEYEKQLEVSAKQQEETARQLEITERHQREHEAFMARSREHQDRYAKLLDTWEEQTKRLDALLTKWEQRS